MHAYLDTGMLQQKKAKSCKVIMTNVYCGPAIGALGVAGLGVWGVLQLSLGVARSTGRTLQPGKTDTMREESFLRSSNAAASEHPASRVLSNQQAPVQSMQQQEQQTNVPTDLLSGAPKQAQQSVWRLWR